MLESVFEYFSFISQVCKEMCDEKSSGEKQMDSIQKNSPIMVRGTHLDSSKIILVTALGTYLHHVFHSDGFRGCYLNYICEQKRL